jgi:hypothetical protein
MKRAAAVLLVLCGLLTARASAADKMSGIPMAGEVAFVSAVTADLNTRFPTIDAARKAGYIRYTDEDDTGAISYANLHWTSADMAHPSQLWYDVKGRLIGADFSVLQADSPNPPNLFGIDPGRWQKFGAHVHYGLVGPNKTTVYGAVGAKGLAKVDATVEDASAKTLVAAGIAKQLKDVRFVFEFPAIWDLTVWLIPNRDGAFADANPDVKPAHSSGMAM